jgi:hypothetical protein
MNSLLLKDFPFSTTIAYEKGDEATFNGVVYVFNPRKNQDQVSVNIYPFDKKNGWEIKA